MADKTSRCKPNKGLHQSSDIGNCKQFANVGSHSPKFANINSSKSLFMYISEGMFNDNFDTILSTNSRISKT